MQDRIAPQCPLCNQVVASTPNGDPNDAVDRHLGLGTCTGLPGGEDRRKAVLKQKKEKGEVCWRKGCAKTIVVQIKCNVSLPVSKILAMIRLTNVQTCKHTFCPTHRSTAAHSCSETSTPGSSRVTTPQAPSKQTEPSKQNPFTRTTKPVLSPSQPSKLGSSSTHPPSSSSSTNPAPITASLDAKSAAAAAALRRAGQDVKVPFVKTKTEK